MSAASAHYGVFAKLVSSARAVRQSCDSPSRVFGRRRGTEAGDGDGGQGTGDGNGKRRRKGESAERKDGKAKERREEWRAMNFTKLGEPDLDSDSDSGSGSGSVGRQGGFSPLRVVQ